MMFTKEPAVNVRNVNLEKGIAVIRFSNCSLIVHTMRIISVDLFGGLVLKHKYRRDKTKYHVSNEYTTKRWAGYEVETVGE